MAKKVSGTRKKESKKDAIAFTPREEKRDLGKVLREHFPRKAHGKWVAHERGRHPIEVLEHSNIGRIPELIPIRYGRMVKSPFTFFRGSAALMATDLSNTPNSGINVQICGDCHLLNFGAYATPERNIVVDINDFDETLQGPWEWDVKRLATSLVLACRANRFTPDQCRDAAEAVVRSYRTAMRKLSEMRALDIWYSKMDLDTYIAGIQERQFRKAAIANIAKRKEKSINEYYLPKLTTERDGRRVFKENPPLVYHSEEQRDAKFLEMARGVFHDYRESLDHSRKVLLDRYVLTDVAMKIVGIGSVGTYCGVLLLMAAEDDAIILQVKEARESVLEKHLGKSNYKNHGHRVVEGQRLMQSYSDMFLGWTKSPGGHHFYIRQLKDMKMSPVPEMWSPSRAIEVATSLGWVLARSHARSGDSVIISGYMGTNGVFDAAIANFAVAYAKQTEKDHQALIAAIKSGELEAYFE